MASKSRSGLTKEEREDFLRAHGFVPLRSGKGSHEMWEHPELKLLARANKISLPANLMSNPSQKPWETTLCADPAGGTWRAMVKHAEWCLSTAEQIKNASAHEQLRCKVASQFRQAVHDMRQWKKDLRHHFKADLSLEKAPPAPFKYEDFKELLAKKNQLSKPSM
ncbi:MAG: hypothetical protein K8R48_08155 [Alphaproteobacteria bacterium]|nr:hypothetical protein [Alphaproteobacteria bacterium]